MADWTFVPIYPYVVRRIGPTTLITEYEDFTESRREKSSAMKRIFREKHRVDATDMKAILDFYDTKGTVTAFSKVTYDPQDAAAVETDVRFTKAPVFSRAGYDEFTTTIEFRET